MLAIKPVDDSTRALLIWNDPAMPFRSRLMPPSNGLKHVEEILNEGEGIDEVSSKMQPMHIDEVH